MQVLIRNMFPVRSKRNIFVSWGAEVAYQQSVHIKFSLNLIGFILQLVIPKRLPNAVITFNNVELDFLQ